MLKRENIQHFQLQLMAGKAIIRVQDLVREGSYTFSLEESPATAIRNVIGGKSMELVLQKNGKNLFIKDY